MEQQEQFIIEDKEYTTSQASSYLGVSESLLLQWRRSIKNPLPYIKRVDGRVYYLGADLKALKEKRAMVALRIEATI